ncbi:aldehyde dehydrogenase family protein [Lutibaculum baratangense]|uniref:Aldehyde dehydrogenase n=1 Tax=Lutibaculum baratangense AMV1 TaxID=631454 RepID=V4RDH4_9HYPH|nr:aldehyde dehydrogenase family protein [Lutibaculum baratangense]ESR23409.1 Aldehyde dehydrogenase [Lutibaculum baratangense AMV1]
MNSTADPGLYSGFQSIFIAGQWRRGRGGKPIEDTNPFNGDTLAEISTASAEDVDEACRASLEAQREWAALVPAARAEIMMKATQIVEARQEEIVSWLVREAGSTRLKATMEWTFVQGVFKEAASLPHMVEGRILPNDIPGKESRVYRKPVGVVALISPWNWPFQLTARTLAPALAVGNGVVVKPASDTPITGGLLFAKILEEAGLPEGLLSVLPGPGSEVGNTLIMHEIPRVVSFTGSTLVGRGIAKASADGKKIKRLELELGGNSPIVVLDDADLDLAVEASVFGKFLHQGQICMISNRLVVTEKIYDEFVSRFVDRVKGLKVGDPSDPDTFIGPIINRSQLDSVVEKIEKGKKGARMLAGGEPDGQVLPPHVFADIPTDSALAQEEIFGPVAPILKARDEQDALKIANDTEYGLSSAVFTRDVEKGTRFARSIEAGMAHVNDQPVNDLPFNPFGGEKNSGIGRFNGRWAIDAFTTDQWVTVQHVPRPYPFSLKDLVG